MAKIKDSKKQFVQNINVGLMGISFFLIFTGFFTVGGIQTLVFDSAQIANSTGYVEGFHGDGLWSLGLCYAFFTLTNLISPSILALMGLRPSMFVGALTYVLFIVPLLYLNGIFLYISSSILGVGAAIFWTAQGKFLSLNSNEKTISRNTGIFYTMLQSSYCVGNVFVYFYFRGKSEIDKETRDIVSSVLLSVASLGSLLILLYRPTPWADKEEEDQTVYSALKDHAKFFFTIDMILLSFTFFYTGILLNLWSAVYGTCIGFTAAFGDERKGLTAISGMFVSVGEVLGGVIIGKLGSWTHKVGRSPIIISGFIFSALAFILGFINLPNESPLGETTLLQTALIDSNQYLVIIGSFLLGLADACIVTQCFSLMAGTFHQNTSSAFAIFHFMQGIASSLAFFYSSLLPLYWQLLIALISASLGTITFCYVEYKNRGKEVELKDEISAL